VLGLKSDRASLGCNPSQAADQRKKNYHRNTHKISAHSVNHRGRAISHSSASGDGADDQTKWGALLGGSDLPGLPKSIILCAYRIIIVTSSIKRISCAGVSYCVPVQVDS
jgi:hypothetical protein